jgi:hypothetical protein
LATARVYLSSGYRAASCATAPHLAAQCCRARSGSRDGRPLHGFGNRRGIAVVVLVPLEEWLDVLRSRASRRQVPPPSLVPWPLFCRLEGGERTFVTAKPGDGRATPTFREAQDICEGGSRFAPFQCTGRAALARSSNSFSWRRKKKIPAAAMPIATTSKSKLIGPATSLIFSPNR